MEPASIRYMNPGAMWGRTGKRISADKEVATNNPLAVKWGSARTVYLSDGLGQGNNIAVFPTFVQGICAQLDLWCSSPRYKNRPFADAIAVWSGGNYVESYINFVLARVPDMARDTVMDDAFWVSQNGIAFLKAQAWHEAGKPYPAPEGDWVEAQRRVLGDMMEEPTPPPDVDPVPPIPPIYPSPYPYPYPRPRPTVPVPAPVPVKLPWYRRAWTWLATSLFGSGIMIGGVQLNANTLLALTLLLVVISTIGGVYFIGKHKNWWG